MNQYKKFCPNVYVAECAEQHAKGDTITMTTRHGKEHEAIIHNLVSERDGLYYYSVVRADGFNIQEWAKRRAERLQGYAANAEARSNEAWKKSHKDSDFLSLGEPIKVGHHSEKRHRKAIEDAWNNMGKSVAEQDKADALAERAAYWASRTDDINLSMPESVDYYEHKLEVARARHAGIKSGEIERRHSFDLQYARKAVKDLEGKVKLAHRLWA